MKNIPVRPKSPGEHLKNVLHEKNLKNVELADRLGRSAQYVTDIIKGKKVMDVDLAIELAGALDNDPSAQEWMEVAIQYRLVSQEPTRSAILDKHPYAKELIKLKWVDGSRSPLDLDQELTDFWALQQMAANYRQSPKLSVNETARRAWAIQVYRKAQQQTDLPRYDSTRLPALIDELKALRVKVDDVQTVESVLNRYGIQFVMLSNPKQCPVDGVASMNRDAGGTPHPYVGLSLRISRLDSFWFTLMHELAHIHAEDEAVEPDTVDAPNIENPVEAQADAWARQALLDDTKYQAFILAGDYSFRAIEREASEQHVHPSILIGRMKRDHILDWSQFAREHPVVRDLLLASAD
jgi:HTH-type transcriptional regulator / antitoxin HigA